MKQSSVVLSLVIGAGLIGCTPPVEDRATVEANSIGVASIELERTTVDNDPVLQIRGFDASDRQIAKLTLRTGTVRYTWDPEIPAESHMGTELSIWIDGVGTGEQVVPDLDPHLLTLSNKHVQPFAEIPEVARELLDEAGIKVREHKTAPGIEAPFNSVHWCWSDPPRFRPTALTHCCFGLNDDLSPYYEVTQTTATSHAYRWYPSGQAACRTSGGSSNCSDMGCYFGPCGVGGFVNSGGSNNGWYASVENDSTSCGFNGAVPMTVYGDDSYSSGTCPYTGCSNGVPY